MPVWNHRVHQRLTVHKAIGRCPCNVRNVEVPVKKSRLVKVAASAVFVAALAAACADGAAGEDPGVEEQEDDAAAGDEAETQEAGQEDEEGDEGEPEVSLEEL